MKILNKYFKDIKVNSINETNNNLDIEYYFKLRGYRKNQNSEINDFYIKDNKDLYLFTPLGIGDALIFFSLVKELARRYDNVHLYTSSYNYNNMVRLYKSISNVEIIEGTVENNRILVNFETLTIGWDHFTKILEIDPNVQGEIYYYNLTGISIENKWNDFYFERDLKKEQEVFYDILDLKDGEDFIFFT